MMPAAKSPNGASHPVLITFPPSLDSELARFLLQHTESLIASSNTPSFFLRSPPCGTGAQSFSRFFTTNLCTLQGRSQSQPITTNTARRTPPVARSASGKEAGDFRLTLFNQSLAFATAVFAYYHLLPHRDLMIEPLSFETPLSNGKPFAGPIPYFQDCSHCFCG